MDSPFNQGFGRGHNPSSLLQTSANSSAYQVNVNRTKTRKWVEAKAQNYDGDDWGASEYDDDDEPPLPPLPSAPSSAAATAAPASQPAPHRLASPPNVQSSVDNQAVISGSATLSPTVQRADKALPSVVASPPPLPRPSDVYRRMEEDKERQHHTSLDSARLETHDQPSGSGRPLDSTGKGDASGAGDGPGERDVRRDSLSPQLPDVARMSAFGLDLFAPSGRDFSLGPAIPEHDSDSPSTPSPLPHDKTSAANQGVPVSSAVSTHPLSGFPETARKTPDSHLASLPSQQSRTTTPLSLEKRKPSPPTFETAPLSRKPVEEESKGDDADPSHADAPHIRTDSSMAPVVSDLPHEEPPRVTASAVLEHPQARQPTLQPGNAWPAVLPLRTPSPRAPSLDQTKLLALSGPKSPEAAEVDREAAADLEAEPRSLQREPTFNTISSSPVKDNDVLSDEILRSLSPRASSSAGPLSADSHKHLDPGNPSSVRESSYTLRDYDNYWADTSDRPGGSPTAPAALDREASTGTAMETAEEDEGAALEASDSRRRFSWEADGREPRPTSADPANKPSTPLEPTAAADADADYQSDQETATSSPVAGTDGRNSTAHDPAPEARGAAVSPEVQKPLLLPEPPSPLSAFSDKQASIGRESKRPSLAEEKALAQAAGGPSPPTPPLESHPAFATQSPVESAGSTQPPVMAFREIMGMTHPVERIAKYNETRQYFASADSGLNTWLAALQVQYPEYANGPVPFSAAASRQAAQPLSPSSAGAQSTAQQPYYQQYLNASAPSAPHSGRSRLGGLQAPSQSTGSTFGHPSNQIGTRSKEFMQSAGKMGKGLLSKGKNKLRGSGDKAESTDPTVQPNPRNERRSSWALSLGARSRPDEAGPHAGSKAHFGNASIRSMWTGQPPPAEPAVEPRPPQQMPQPYPQGSGQPHGGARDSISSGPGQTGRALARPGSADCATAGLSRLDIPAATSPAFRREGLGIGSGMGGVAQPGLVDERCLTSEQSAVAAQDRSPDGWVLVPRPTGSQPQDAFPDHGAAPQPQPQPTVDAPKRISSFVGLPPIRRSSTFGLTARAKRASRRFSLDEDGSDDDGKTDGNDYDKPGISSAKGGCPRRTDQPSGPVDPPLLVPSPSTQPGNPQELALAGAVKLDLSSPRTEEPRGAKALETASRTSQSPSRGPVAAASPVQASPSSARPQMLTSPIPKLLEGTWVLEESHLVEPLQPMTRHRAGTGSPQQHVFYDWDKETGLPTAAHTRQPPYTVPPSSAQRFPELFRYPSDQDAQRPPSRSRMWRQPDPRFHRAPSPRGDTAAPRNSNDGLRLVDGVAVPPPDIVRNHHGRSASKEGGQQTATASPTHFEETRQGAGDFYSDDASESSFATEDFPESNRRQSGFVFSIPGRASTDNGWRRAHNVRASDYRGTEACKPTHPQPEQIAHSSVLGFGGQATTTSSLRRPSYSSLTTDQDYPSPRRDEVEEKKKKKRFSNMAALSSLKDMFHSSGHERGSKLQAVQTAGMGAGSQLQQRAGPKGPLPIPPHGLGRSSTTSSFEPPPPPPIGAGGTQGRGRRGSMSGIISDLLGRKPVSRPGGREGPAHAQSSADLRDRLQHPPQSPRFPATGESPHPSTGPQQPPRSSMETHIIRGRAASMDALRSPTQTTIRPVGPVPGHQARPSPLGFAVRMTHGDAAANGGVRQPPQDIRHLPRSHLESGQPQMPSHGKQAAASHKQTSPSLAGIGAQHDAAEEAEALRVSTISPDLSVTSDGKAPERQTAHQGNSDYELTRDLRGYPVSDVAAEDAGWVGASAATRETHGLVSSDGLCDRGKAMPAQQTPAAFDRPAYTVGPQPHHGTSIGNRTEGGDHSSGPQRSLPPVPRKSLQNELPREPAASNAGRAQPKPPGPGQSRQRGRPHVSQRSESTLASYRPDQPGSPTVGSRWKGLRNRMSEQMAHMAPQSQGKSDKGDRLGGLKLLGAFRRMSKQLEPSSRSPSRQGEPLQEAPQRQQYPPQQGQQPPPSSPPPLKQQPQPQQRLVQPAVRSSPLQVGAVSQHGMASPPPGPLGQPLGSSSGAKRQDMGQEEPLYDQVPIPRGYGAVHGEGLVAPTAYDTRRHPLPGHYGQPPRRAPYIAPTGQPGPLRHDSVSSVGMGPRSPRPGSVEEGGAKTGLGVIMAHQPSINSLSTWQGSRLDEREAMESQAGLVLPTSAGHGRLRSHGHSDPASSASTAAGAASRHSQSPTTPTASHPSAAGSANKTAEAVTEDGQVKRHLGEDGSGRRGSPSRNGEVADASRQRSASELRTARGDGARTQEAKKSAEREGPAVELDDTADRYARSRRLESQEEKILYRPEEADDYQPQMSATSYPGQEWNPYGEMGFGEWKED